MAQADAAQASHHPVSHRRDPHAQLVTCDGGGRGAIGEQLELLADAVLSLAARAVEVLVEGARVKAAALERSDDKARIGALLIVLGFADDAPLAAPAVERRIAKVTENADRRAARQMAACTRPV